jgi:hypothetical protein
MNDQNVDRSRRAFLAKVAYTAPLIVTLNVMPSIASTGSPVTTSSIEDGVPRQQKVGHHHNKWHWR